jgi:hypothetical protein
MEFVSVHVDPAWSKTLHREFWECLRVQVSSPASFLLGDWNFVHSDEGRLSVVSGASTPQAGGIDLDFEHTLANFTEIYQDEFTRKGGAAALKTLSRLDRCYCSLPPAILFELKPAGSTLFSVIPEFELSDHVPVLFSFEAINLNNERTMTTIPRWVASSPGFSDDVREVLALYDLSDEPHAALCELKDVFALAAGRTRARMRNKGLGGTEVVFHYLLGAWQAARRGDAAGFRRCSLAAPEALQFADLVGASVFLFDQVGLLKCIQKAALAVECEREAQELLEHFVSDIKVKNIQKRKRVWTKTRRRISIATIRSAEGRPPDGWDGSIANIQVHWQPIFGGRPRGSEADISRTMGAMDKFLQAAPQGDSIGDNDVILSFEQFSLIIAKLKYSAPGPDGIPYTCWRSAGATGAKILYDIYLSMLDGQDPPPSFLDSSLIFIHKDLAEGESESISRKASETRPLSLGNTDGKIVASALNVPLARACAAQVSQMQHGFVKGRQLTDSVWSLEQSMISAAISAGAYDTPVAILLDIAAAFPSLCWMFLFAALRAWKLPPGLIAAISSLYEGSSACIFFAGKRSLTRIVFGGGIKQGCPMSASIFALCYDLVLRTLVTVGDPSSLKVLAYADDTALIIRQLWKILAKLTNMLVEVGLASNLWINTRKTYVICLDMKVQFAWLKAKMSTIAPTMSLAKITYAARYLGLEVGPCAPAGQFRSTAIRLVAAARVLRPECGCAAAALRQFRPRVLSIAAHRLQFAPVDATLTKAVRQGLAIVASAPMFAIPNDIYGCLDDLSLQLPCIDVEVLGQSSMLRAACLSVKFHVLSRELALLMGSDDVLLRIPAWVASTGFVRAEVALAKFWAIEAARRIPQVKGYQREVAKMLVSRSLLPRRSLAIKVLAARANALGCMQYDSRLALELWFRLRSLGKLPATSQLIVIKTVCNAWTTTSRLQGEVRDCCFCGAPKSDRLLHFAGCDSVRTAACTLPLPSSMRWPFIDCPASFLGLHPMPEKIFAANAVLLDIVHAVYTTIKYRSWEKDDLAAMFAVRLAELAGRSQFVRAIFYDGG